jgi:hypothetical protein
VTAYFDQKHSEARRVEEAIAACADVGPTWIRAAKELEAIDRAVIWDVSICAEMPDFPADLREGIHKTILAKSVEGQPLNAKGLDFESIADRVKLLQDLIWELHSMFHELANMRLEGFSDDPRAPLYALYASGEELREKLAANENPFQLWKRPVAEDLEHFLFRVSDETARACMGPGAELLASFPVVSLEDAIRAKRAFLGLPPTEDMEAEADGERERLRRLTEARP